MDQRHVLDRALHEAAVAVALRAGRRRVLRGVVDGKDDAVVQLRQPPDALEVDLLQLRRLRLVRLPRDRDADRHQPEVAVHADDPVLPHHPLRRVVGDADDDLQVRRLHRAWRDRRDHERDPEG